MIEILRLRNFQAHEDLLIQLGPITVIKGESDRGKSSIIRAIGWVLFNDLRGDSFIRNGAEWTKVYLRVDGKTLLRQRGKHNLYKLDGETFKAFGAGAVPDPIKRLLNVSEVNLQTQHENPFWVMDSPGQVSKKLNDLANLEIMDRALAATSSRIRKTKSQQEVLLEEKTQIQKAIKESKWIVETDADLQTAMSLHAEYLECRSKIDAIRAIVGEFKQNVIRRKRASEIASQGLELSNIWQRYNAIDRNLTKLQNLVSELKNAKPIKVPDVTELVKVRKEGDTLSSRLYTLEGIVKEYKLNRKQLKVDRIEQSNLETELKQAQQGQCPLCGRSDG